LKTALKTGLSLKDGSRAHWKIDVGAERVTSKGGKTKKHNNLFSNGVVHPKQLAG